MKWFPNIVGSSNNHHAFDCAENRRSRTNGVSNVYDTHEPALSLLYIIVRPSSCYFVTIRILIKAHFERRETRQTETVVLASFTTRSDCPGVVLLVSRYS